MAGFARDELSMYLIILLSYISQLNNYREKTMESALTEGAPLLIRPFLTNQLFFRPSLKRTSFGAYLA